MISYNIVAVLEKRCKCAMALPTHKITFIVEDVDEKKAAQQARRMLRHISSGTVLDLSVTKARWEE